MSVFKDFPGLENLKKKFKDFQGLSRTRKSPETSQTTSEKPASNLIQFQFVMPVIIKDLL